MLGGWGEFALVVLGVVEVDVADRVTVAGVGGGPVVVGDDGDGLCGVSGSDADPASAAEVDGAFVADFELVDGGVVLDGQVLGPAEMFCAGPGLVRGAAAQRAVPAAGVVVLAVALEQGLQLG